MVSPAAGAEMYLKLGDIKGESRAKGFEGWIIIESMNIDGHLRAGAAGSLGFVKHVDLASIPMTLGVARGKLYPRATLVMLRNGQEGAVEFAKVDFKDVWVSGISQGTADGGETTVEMATISFREIFYSYIPLDGEKVSSYVEADDGKDTDNDGMTDDFEDFFGFDKLVDDGDLDADKDGFTNRQEFRLGLNPKSAGSTFKLNAAKEAGENGKVKLSWETRPGKRYRILTSPTLDGKFSLFRDVTAKELTEEIDLGELGLKGFYRVEEVLE